MNFRGWIETKNREYWILISSAIIVDISVNLTKLGNFWVKRKKKVYNNDI